MSTTLDSQASSQHATLNAAGAIRVSIRATAGHFHKEIDVCLPKVSSLDEVIPEVTALLGAPSISKPWRATTAAGRPLDHSVTLGETPLADGALILLRPHSNVPTPAIRDAAEALAQAGTATPRGMATVWTFIGLGAGAAVATPLLGLAGALALVAVAAVCVALWTRRGSADWHALSPAALATSAAAAGYAVGEARLGLYAAAAVALVALALLHMAGLASARLAGAAVAGAVLGIAWASASFMPSAEAGAAAVLVVGLVLIATAPAVSTRCAGLHVPHLPSAGEDLAVADSPAATDAQAARARALYEGCLCAVAGGFLPASCVLSLAGSQLGFIQALCLVAAGAVVLHAGRHASLIGAWALMLAAALTCLAACTLAVAYLDHAPLAQAWPLLIAPALLIALMTSACLWAPRLRSLEPTTMVWIERAEAACITASLPLALHVAGVFMAIRGLG